MTSSWLHTLALHPETFEPLGPPIAVDVAARQLMTTLQPRAEALRALGVGAQLRGEKRRLPTIDLGDPRRAGWTFVVGADDPARAETTAILQRLAVDRGMVQPTRPLVYSGEDPWDWINDVYRTEPPVPRYVLIAAGPQYVPFDLQSLLGTDAAVGRLSFPSGAELERYVEKVLRLERRDEPATDAEVMIFAPNGGGNDATSYSEPHMAKPLADYFSRRGDVAVHYLAAAEASRSAFFTACTERRPALIYTASHGLAPPTDMAAAREMSGAICCRPVEIASGKAETIAASDISTDDPFAEGAVVFQFACFGAGVPAISEARSWLTGRPERLAEVDFISALPQRLLGHPRGPIGFVGHVDEAFVEGFTDPFDPDASNVWKSRLRPFLEAVEALVGLQPAGLSLSSLAQQFTLGNDRLADAAIKARSGVPDTPAAQGRLVSNFIRRTDAKNYIVLGDPAAKLRMPTREP